MKFFTKLSPHISVPLLYIVLTVNLAIRFLFGSAFGALILVGSIYVALLWYGTTSPFGFQELMLWIDDLSPEYKVGLSSAIVTIAGFVIAFHTATVNWRNQLRAQLKAQAAGEIESFFAAVTSRMNEVSFYAESIIDAVNDIQKGCSFSNAGFHVAYLQRQAPKFMTAREQLSQASVEIHRLLGKNYNLITSVWGALESSLSATDVLKDVASAMWIRVPIVNLDDPNHVQHFVNQANVSECLKLIETCNDNYEKLSGLSGGVHGALMAPIIDLNLSMYINFLVRRKEFKSFVGIFHKKMNKDS